MKPSSGSKAWVIGAMIPIAARDGIARPMLATLTARVAARPVCPIQTPDGQRDRGGDQERDARDPDLLQEPDGDPVGTGPVRRIEQPADHPTAAPRPGSSRSGAGCRAAWSLAQGVRRRWIRTKTMSTAIASTIDGHGPGQDLGREAAVVALEDEEAQPAERGAERRRDGHQADRRDARQAQAGNDQGHGQRQDDPPEALAPVVAHPVGRVQDVGRRSRRSRPRCSGRG